MRGLLAVGLVVIGLLAGCAAGTDPPRGEAGPAVPADAVLNDTTQIGFADADHGYAVLSRCPSTPCETWAASTVDGGKTWTGVVVSDVSYSGQTPRVSMRVLDATHAMLIAYDHDARWLTSDGGKSWDHAPLLVSGTIDEIPNSGFAEARFGALPAQVVIEVTSVGGAIAQLAHAPDAPIRALDSSVERAADGSYWMRGDNDERAWIFVSRDRGRSWREVPLPVADPAIRQTIGSFMLASANGRVVYLVDRYAFKVWRTSDDGAGWDALPVPIPKPTEDIGLSARDTSDGRLAIVDGRGTTAYEITPTGTTFTPIPVEEVRSRRSTTGRDVTVNVIGGTRTYVTTVDGKTFTPLPFLVPTR